MRQNMDLEFEKYCLVDASPTTVLPPLRRRERKKPKENFKSIKNHTLSLKVDENFTEINFNHSRNASNINIAPRRGSVYQCSQEMNKMENFEVRSKIEISRDSATSLSCGVVDSVCSSDEDISSNDPLDFANLSSSPYVTLNKSLSAKLALPHSPTRSESDSLNTPRTRFARKMFDPIVKSVKSKNRGLRKSLLQDFTKTEHEKNYNSSPAHLHGLIKIEKKDGIPFFEFAMKSPEDIIIAKTWKVKDSSTWVYTFHSVQNKKRNLRYCVKESFIIAQMQVSCYLRQKSVLDKSMVTEFILYDISKFGTHPVGPEGLHSGLESGAMVIEVPFEKRESLKFKKNDRTVKNLLDLPKVNVVIPSGIHGLSSVEGHGPASLLDRWRSGGVCDCGGWDMACPIHVFSNLNVSVGENYSPFVLFGQGKKDKLPSLTMKVTEEGHYAVDFHAQLSALQAFSVCISILHTIEGICGKTEKNNQCDSLRVLVKQDKITNLIDALMEEEKCKVDKKMEEVVSSFVVKPSFSPMSRV